jgi:hypothetical protein
MSSSHDMMVQQLNIGGPPTSGGAAPRPPNPIAMNAASCQRRVRERLSYVPQSLRSQLERAYSDRRYPAELVTVYELGIAPIVWRAQHDAEDAAGHKRPGNATLLRLVELVRVWWPTYEEVGDRLPSRIFHAADTILWTAHVMYGEHLGGPRRIARTPRPHKRRRMAPELHRAGEFGAASRRLVGEIFAA